MKNVVKKTVLALSASAILLTGCGEENEDVVETLALSTAGIGTGETEPENGGEESGAIGSKAPAARDKNYDVSWEVAADWDGTLTIGTVLASQELEAAVEGFNGRNGDFKAEIIDYYDEQRGYEDSTTQFKLDIVRGNAPDIMVISGVDYEVLVGKGILVDLYQCMERDSGFSADMLMPTVIEAYETDGRLFGIAPGFQLYTMWGNQSVIKDKSGVTPTELVQLLKDAGKNINAIFGFSVDEPVLKTLCTFGMDEFVDWGNGICSFDSQEFKDLLAFVKEYNSSSIGRREMLKEIRTEDIVMTPGLITSVVDYQLQAKIYNDNLAFIGYPTSSGSGTAVGYRGSEIGITAQAGNKDAAWEFIKYFVTDGYDGQGFPILKERFDEVMEQAMQPEYTTENGVTQKMIKGIYYGGTSDDDIMVEEATQEDVDAVIRLIENAKNRYKYNVEILDIIEEETEMYFNGQKELDDVAALIQNRAGLYLQEQMN